MWYTTLGKISRINTPVFVRIRWYLNLLTLCYLGILHYVDLHDWLKMTPVRSQYQFSLKPEHFKISVGWGEAWVWSFQLGWSVVGSFVFVFIMLSFLNCPSPWQIHGKNRQMRVVLLHTYYCQISDPDSYRAGKHRKPCRHRLKHCLQF